MGEPKLLPKAPGVFSDPFIRLLLSDAFWTSGNPEVGWKPEEASRASRCRIRQFNLCWNYFLGYCAGAGPPFLFRLFRKSPRSNRTKPP